MIALRVTGYELKEEIAHTSTRNAQPVTRISIYFYRYCITAIENEPHKLLIKGV